MLNNLLEVFLAFEYYHWFTLKCFIKFGFYLSDILAFVENFLGNVLLLISHGGIILLGEKCLF